MFYSTNLKNEKKSEINSKAKRNTIPILIFIIVIIIIVLFVLNKYHIIKKSAFLPNTQINSSLPIWPMFQYDARHTGQCPYDTSKNNGALKWKFKIDDSFMAVISPAIGSDGTVYIRSNDGYLYAIGGK